jgi:hypothetical protein
MDFSEWAGEFRRKHPAWGDVIECVGFIIAVGSAVLLGLLIFTTGKTSAQENPMTISWWNFTTNQFEQYEDITTDELAKQLLPQITPAQRLYEVKRLQGKTILQAMAEVLEVITSAHRQPSIVAQP